MIERTVSSNLVEGRALAKQLVPKPGQASIRDPGHLAELALSPGMKVIIVLNPTHLAYASIFISLMLNNKVAGERCLGLATGGTTEPLRYSLAMPEFLRQKLDLALDPTTVLFADTLDDYTWDRATYDRVAAIIGPETGRLDNKAWPWTYRHEQLTWLMRLGVRPEQLISPLLKYDRADEAVAAFQAQLAEKVNRVLIRYFSAGINGHYAFQEAGSYHSLFAPTRLIEMLFTTRVQNSFAVLKPGDEPINPALREISAEYELLYWGELVDKILALRGEFNRTSQLPERLKHVAEPLERLFNNFSDEWTRAQEIIKRLPGGAITQGLGETLDRTFFNMVMLSGLHKRRATYHALEGALEGGRRWPAAALRAAENSVWLVDAAAAGDLRESDRYFFFEPDDRLVEPFNPKKIEEQFWSSYPPEVKTALRRVIEQA